MWKTFCLWLKGLNFRSSRKVVRRLIISDICFCNLAQLSSARSNLYLACSRPKSVWLHCSFSFPPSIRGPPVLMIRKWGRGHSSNRLALRTHTLTEGGEEIKSINPTEGPLTGRPVLWMRNCRMLSFIHCCESMYCGETFWFMFTKRENGEWNDLEKFVVTIPGRFTP